LALPRLELQAKATTNVEPLDAKSSEESLTFSYTKTYFVLFFFPSLVVTCQVWRVVVMALHRMGVGRIFSVGE